MNKAFAPGRGPPLPSGANTALCAYIKGTSVPKFEGAKCSTVGPASKREGECLAGNLSAVRVVHRLRRFAWGRHGAKGRVSEQVRHTTFVTVPSWYGSAVFIPARYSSTPCALSAAVRASLTLRAVLGSKATKCSGQAGGSRPGCWRRECRSANAQGVRQSLRPSAGKTSRGIRPESLFRAPVLRHRLPPSHAARHPLRRWPRFNGVG